MLPLHQRVRPASKHALSVARAREYHSAAGLWRARAARRAFVSACLSRCRLAGFQKMLKKIAKKKTQPKRKPVVHYDMWADEEPCAAGGGRLEHTHTHARTRTCTRARGERASSVGQGQCPAPAGLCSAHGL